MYVRYSVEKKRKEVEGIFLMVHTCAWNLGSSLAINFLNASRSLTASAEVNSKTFGKIKKEERVKKKISNLTHCYNS